MNKGLEALKELRKQSETHRWLEQQFEKEWLNTIERELLVLEILRKHMKWQGSLQYVKSMAKYWEEEHKSVTQEMLDNYDFPFTVDEFETIARWLKK